MKALIIAGGKGTRLGKLTKNTPKSMLQIGGIPLLEHQISLLKRYGIKNIIILTYHLSELIGSYFKNGSSFGVSITYVKEKEPLGTAGCVKEIENELIEDFIVFYGDVMIDMDLKKLIEFHKKNNSVCTLVVHPNDHPYDSDLVEIDNSKEIIAFHKNPHDENKYFKNLVNAGAYVMSPKILKHIQRGIKSDFGRDIFPKIVNKEKLIGYNTAEYLKDIGTPDRLKNVNEDYLNGKVKRFNSENKRKAIFLDRDGVINKKVDLLYKIEDFELLPDTSQAIKIINKSEFLSIVVTNQPVVARNLCSIEELEEIHKKMETLLGKENAKLDAIYYCPHHPDKGYPEENSEYKIECECRKPNIGMIKMAEKDFNIDTKGSFIIGDSSRDILCGKNAGMKTIAVRTEDGYKELEVEPDYVFKDLNEAVNFIVGGKK